MGTAAESGHDGTSRETCNCVDTPNVTGTSGNGTQATATFNITAPANPGTYDLWVALSDADGTGTTACGGAGGLSQKKVFPSSVTVQVVDQTAPTVTINQAAGQADPTNASPINFTVVFSEIGHRLRDRRRDAAAARPARPTAAGHRQRHDLQRRGQRHDRRRRRSIATIAAGVATTRPATPTPPRPAPTTRSPTTRPRRRSRSTRRPARPTRPTRRRSTSRSSSASRSPASRPATSPLSGTAGGTTTADR